VEPVAVRPTPVVATVREPGAAPSEHTRYANPPGSAPRTSIVTRLPTMLARFIRNGVAPVTRDRSHILPAGTAARSLTVQDGDSVTWIGHMTVLLRLGGVTILTDPWFSRYASPVKGIGPHRYAPPALSLAELPPLDVVLVSHSHRDHLDLDAIGALPNRERITAVVPLGVGHFFRERGYGRVIELAWDEAADLRDLRVTALPAIHWSKRSLFHTNDTLWAAYALESADGARVYFGGDSDYGPIHAEIGRRFGGFDLALLSIGGFYNDGVHCAPENCVRLGLDVGARTLVPLHWGTIYLGEGPPQELPARFAEAAIEHGVAPENVWVMSIGETRTIDARRRERSLGTFAASPTPASDHAGGPPALIASP
jgi:N-acyl-phosphatidylethanolamine-hydrolysing phospholipase D